MIIIHQPALLREHLGDLQKKRSIIGFVPTMGALHEGHISLIQRSKEKADVTVCSIFVNPTQFNDASDFTKYPNRTANDIRLLEKAGTDVLFLPSVSSIYPEGTGSLETYNLGYLETVLEGTFRPGHFQGVCQVMNRLLAAVKPHLLFMGQKDYQQCMVVEKLITDLNLDVKLVPCKTLREADGLAMSSRNLRLTPEQRIQAPLIFQLLNHTRQHLKPGAIAHLRINALEHLRKQGFKPDYFELADARTLSIIEEWNGKTPVVALIAAFLGDVRLIDNLVLTD